MDPLTHGMASLALQRAFFPRVSWRSGAVIVSAGVVSDLDWFSATVGPAQFLRWHRAVAHSLAFVVFLAAASFLFAQTTKDAVGGLWRGFSWLAVVLAALLHLILDVCQADPVALLWPISERRFGLDLLPSVDPWLLAILALSILLPELFLLIGEEIGSRTKRPRGRNGAIVGFAFVALYLGGRATFHSNAVATLEAHTVAGEMPRRAAAFADSTSPFLWHGIVETQSTVNLIQLHSGLGEVMEASGPTTWHKPEPSPMLAAAQASPAAQIFLKYAQFPKATVQKETEGFSVEIQDLKDQAAEEKSHAVVADIKLDENSGLVSSELQWVRKAQNP